MNTPNLPAELQSFVTAVEQYRNSAPALGVPLLKFVKTGKWLLGVNNEPADGIRAAVNPMAIRIGYVVWQEGQVVAESPLVPFTAGWTSVPEIEGNSKERTRKYVVGMKLIDDGDVECIFSTATDGGAKAIENLIGEFYLRAKAGSPYFVPVVTLGADSYRHPSYGITFKPSLKVDSWISMEGKTEPAKVEGTTRPRRNLA